MIIETNGISIPSSPEVLNKIKGAITEASSSWTRVDGEQDFIKDLFTDLAKEVDLPKAYLVKVAKYFHKQNIAEVTADQETVTELYEKIFGISTQ
jgi:hypothetical protein